MFDATLTKFVSVPLFISMLTITLQQMLSITSETCLEPNRTTTFVVKKSTIVDVRMSSKYASVRCSKYCRTLDSIERNEIVDTEWVDYNLAF